jgi:mono/diheme cytochrome c family protein
MKKLAFALACGLFTLAPGAALAQEKGNATGDAAAGKAYWDRMPPQGTLCWACHGRNGEGGFGPDLAGRGLSAAQVARAVRQPWGIMPAFTESQFSGQDAADVAAYFATLPKVAEPGKWRFTAPKDAPAGQASMINMGCGQCHNATFDNPRGDIGGTGMDFEEFAGLVYNHTGEMPKLRALIGEQGTNLAMGNFVKTRLTITELQSIFTWAHDDIGPRVPMTGRLSKGEAGADGVTYILTVANRGVPGKGLTAEDIAVSLAIPADAGVVAATGAGYKGVTTDEKTKASVAVWQLPHSAPKDQERITITLSKPATASTPLRGELRWTRPERKNGPAQDTAQIAPAPL